jgi:hypothetical protein
MARINFTHEGKASAFFTTSCRFLYTAVEVVKNLIPPNVITTPANANPNATPNDPSLSQDINEDKKVSGIRANQTSHVAAVAINTKPQMTFCHQGKALYFTAIINSPLQSRVEAKKNQIPRSIIAKPVNADPNANKAIQDWTLPPVVFIDAFAA